MKRLALIALATLALAGCREEETTEPGKAVRPVRTMEVTETSALHERFFVGVARAAREATMSFGVPGTVRTFDIRLGETVEEGSLVAALDPAPFEAEVARLEAELESAEATLANAKAQTERQRVLVEREVAAEAKLDSFLGQEGTAVAAVKAVQAALDKAKLDLSYATLTAPYDGIVVATYVENFEEVAGQTPIIRIVDADRIEMVIDVPERFISILPQIEDISVSFPALGDVALAAEITEVGTEASITTGTFPVTVQMDQPEGAPVLPGMTGRARGVPKPGATPDIGLYVPAQAVFTPEGRDAPHVWVVDEDSMTVTERSVTLGGAGSLGIAVQDGLNEGEIVVTAGASSLRSGQDVTFLDGGEN
ncbi:efflux RND transporter periplasmic adaptor subunit [Tropicimonas sp. TH_r6]|uniref:efflux RND transporter periplasmic adaptor subunit n=1 Tax=Tropicimonas sp. TH_r6 TaxID=3082085 RepID=UPI002955407C|nr:efflux RND transporter periplasmic adaptor subunit [Tropicimonas sp. TH_r6]MDV7145668.1 efflux RND transporter periplasmic adaptor subunit [Tropicimonas sp. TH_r6]